MNTEYKIRNYLLSRGWTQGEVNATQVYRGNGVEGFGWYVIPFGETAQFWGKTWSDIEESIKDDMPVKNPAAVALGTLGGQSTSEAKVAAARRNGRKGGRPKRSPE